jgi:hypothetical protein
MKKRIVAIILAVAMTTVVCAPSNMRYVQAVQFTVAESSAVMYTTGIVKVYSQPDTTSTVVTELAKNLPVKVTGVTSNGWYQVSISGVYYIQAEGLGAQSATDTVTSSLPTDISELTKGTFSFYKNSELSKMDDDDIEDMDENTYIKYLDSFLMGYAMLDYCILQDSGKYLKELYDKQTTYTTMQSYLIDYRNNYFSDSLIGPFKSEKDLKRAINRAIRYDIAKFNSVYKSTSIGSGDETKMSKLVKGVTDAVVAEQGVTYTYELKYGDYRTSDGSTGKGWIISFTKKD